MKFDAKTFLRQLALTRAYQRSSESTIPNIAELDGAAVAARAAAWTSEAATIDGTLKGLEEADTQAAEAYSAAYEAFSKQAAAREAAEKTRGEAKKAVDAAAAAVAAAIKEAGVKDDVLKALVEARDKAQAAVAKLPEDKALADAAGQFKTRASEVEAQLAAARKTVNDKTPEVQTLTVKLGETETALGAAGAAQAAAKTALDAAELKARQTSDALRTAKARKRELDAAIADAKAVTDYQALLAAATAAQSAVQSANEQVASLKSQTATAEQLAQAETAAKAAADKAAADRAAAEQAYGAVVDRAATRFTLGLLKPLSPEQLALATMQAVGLVDAQRAELDPQVKKDVEAQANLAPEARAAQAERLLEARVDEKLRGNMGPFVSLFGTQAGQVPTFNATVQQALFLANGGLLAGWLNPGGNNLTERLAKLEQPAAVADELYLSVLTRRPTAAEAASVAAYWEAGKADRPAAVREMVWSLVTSAEFRFNH
jgi:hypothetical protein